MLARVATATATATATARVASRRMLFTTTATTTKSASKHALSSTSLVWRASIALPQHVRAFCVPLVVLQPRELVLLVSGIPAHCYAGKKNKPKVRDVDIGGAGGGGSVEAPPLTMHILWQWLKPDMGLLLGAVAAAVCVAIANVQIPVALGAIVNVLTKSGASMAILQPLAIRTFALYLSQAALTSSYIFLLSVVGERMAERLRNRLFYSLLQQDIAFFDSHRSGELVDRIAADVQEFKSSFKQIVSLGLRNATQIAGGVYAMFTVSTPMTAAILVFIPLAIGVGTQLGGFLRSMSRRAQDSTADITARSGEIISNMRTVRAFATEDSEYKAMLDLTAKCRHHNIVLGFGIGAYTGLTHLFINSVVLGVLYSGGYMMQRNLLSAGDLMTFLVSTQTVERSLSNMSILFGQVVRGASAGARVLEYMEHIPSMSLKGGRVLPNVVGNIEFVDVAFEYPSRRNQNVLNGLTLKAPAGAVVALCGPSGAGKSTIAGLIERFYDPLSGAVLLDGHDIRDLDATWLRGNVIGYINQEPVLFAASIMDNIRYGCQTATDEQVIDAAKRANADGFIRSFHTGYNTMVGERGATLSGGQRQRIAIARALLKDPPILILDEATSALDAESEQLVQQALERLSVGRTVVVIAHRLSTIKNADIIAVVEGGRIVEQGTHATLINKAGGRYAQLVKHQMSQGSNTAPIIGY